MSVICGRNSKCRGTWNIFGAMSLKVIRIDGCRLSAMSAVSTDLAESRFFSLEYIEGEHKRPGELSRARRGNEQKGRTGDWRGVIRIIRAAVVHATRTNLHFK